MDWWFSFILIKNNLLMTWRRMLWKWFLVLAQLIRTWLCMRLYSLCSIISIAFEFSINIIANLMILLFFWYCISRSILLVPHLYGYGADFLFDATYEHLRRDLYSGILLFIFYQKIIVLNWKKRMYETFIKKKKKIKGKSQVTA